MFYLRDDSMQLNRIISAEFEVANRCNSHDLTPFPVPPSTSPPPWMRTNVLARKVVSPERLYAPVHL
jgi:hypothetical protein